MNIIGRFGLPSASGAPATGLHLSPSGLAGQGTGWLGGVAMLADSVLRGMGQVMFQNNSYAGLLFLLGIAVNSPLFAAAALAGTVTSTLAALLLGADRQMVRAGLFGFNGALVGIALLYFLALNPLTWLCVILAASCATVLMAAMMTLFRGWSLPVLTAPFVLVALSFFMATARFGRIEASGLLPTAGLPVKAGPQGVVTAASLGQGALEGIGQVFFQGHMLSSAIFAAGLLLASRRAFVMAVAGTLTGLLVAWAMGASEVSMRAGAFGFNSVLTAIALGAVFLPPGPRATIYAIFGAAVTPFVAAAAAATMGTFGLPAMTLPFVLTSWVLLLAAQSLPGLTTPAAVRR